MVKRCKKQKNLWFPKKVGKYGGSSLKGKSWNLKGTSWYHFFLVAKKKTLTRSELRSMRHMASHTSASVHHGVVVDSCGLRCDSYPRKGCVGEDQFSCFFKNDFINIHLFILKWLRIYAEVLIVSCVYWSFATDFFVGNATMQLDPKKDLGLKGIFTTILWSGTHNHGLLIN